VQVLVRGVGDVGSAVAHTLWTAGYGVILHDAPLSGTTRRRMAFADALFDGSATLAGVTGVLVEDVGRLDAHLARHDAIPIVVTDFRSLVGWLRPEVLVDARMRKRAVPEDQRDLAPFTVGLGPNFVAGGNIHVAIETSWEGLGGIVVAGRTRALAGEPRELGGHGRDRYVYAPQAGVFRTTATIGDLVRAGDLLASIDAAPLYAPLDGAVRGLTHDGVPVSAKTKVIEVDPRGAAAVVAGLGERPKRIADGVLTAIRSKQSDT
jgi:xanthine dehydrogenase accessory factor